MMTRWGEADCLGMTVGVHSICSRRDLLADMESADTVCGGSKPPPYSKTQPCGYTIRYLHPSMDSGASAGASVPRSLALRTAESAVAYRLATLQSESVLAG